MEAAGESEEMAGRILTTNDEVMIALTEQGRNILADISDTEIVSLLSVFSRINRVMPPEIQPRMTWSAMSVVTVIEAMTRGIIPPISGVAGEEEETEPS